MSENYRKIALEATGLANVSKANFTLAGSNNTGRADLRADVSRKRIKFIIVLNSGLKFALKCDNCLIV